jgi:ketosteroid isomerase-like protein
MSQENVEVVRQAYDAFYRGDADGALAHFDPEVIVDGSKAGRPDIGIGHGREHLRRVVTSWVGTWDEWREEIEEMRDLGRQVLVLTVQYGRSRGSGVEVEAHWAALYEVHGGKITRLDMYDDEAQTLEAAGLSE